MTHKLSVDLEIAEAEHRLYVDVLERYKAEALTTACFAVKHDGRIDDLAKLREEVAHRLARHTSRQTADEQLRRTLMLLSRDRTLRVNLRGKDRGKQKFKS